MAKKPSQPPPASESANKVQITLRLTPEQLRFVTECKAGHPNEAIRTIIEDARLLYGLPSPIVETLVAKYTGDRKLDLAKYDDRRELITRALTEHFANLLAQDRTDK